MDFHAQFQQQIQAEADPRLTQGIYADWLEEQGNSLANLLRRNLSIREFPGWPELHQDWTLLKEPYPFSGDMMSASPRQVGEFRRWLVGSRVAAVYPVGWWREPRWFWWDPVAADLERQIVLVAGRRVGVYNPRQLAARLPVEDYRPLTGRRPDEGPVNWPIRSTRCRFLELLQRCPCGISPTVPLHSIPEDT